MERQNNKRCQTVLRNQWSHDSRIETINYRRKACFRG